MLLKILQDHKYPMNWELLLKVTGASISTVFRAAAPKKKITVKHYRGPQKQGLLDFPMLNVKGGNGLVVSNDDVWNEIGATVGIIIMYFSSP